MYRVILILAVGLIAAWCGFWLYESRVYRGALEAGFEDMRKSGWDASHERISIGGFPVRFEATVARPMFRHRQSGVGWSGPSIRLISLIYDPYHAIVEFPDQQAVLLPEGRVGLITIGMRASVKLSTLDPLEASEAILESTAAVTRVSGRSVTLQNLLLAIRTSGDFGHAYDIAARAKSPGGGTGAFVGSKSSFSAEASVALERPLGPGACDPGPLRIASADIKSLELDVGRALANAGGSFEFGQSGSPTGEAEFKLVDWRHLIEEFAESGYVPASNADLISKIMALLTLFSEDSLRYSGKIGIRQGRIEVGRFEVGSVPAVPDLCEFL